MEKKVKTKFRVFYLIGLLLQLSSFFLDWYYFQVYTNDKRLISYWSYNIIFEWSSLFSDNHTFNQSVRPENLSVPIEMSIISVIAIMLSGYSILFKDPETTEELEKLYPYAYLNFFVLCLNLYYIVVFPIMFLFPNKLYFPFLLVKDPETKLIYSYGIGPGYILQIIAFMLIFPYALFYYQTINTFRLKKHSAEIFVEKYIQQIQEPLDVDKLIAKEESKLKFDDLSTEDHLKVPYNNIKGGD